MQTDNVKSESANDHLWRTKINWKNNMWLIMANEWAKVDKNVAYSLNIEDKIGPVVIDTNPINTSMTKFTANGLIETTNALSK